MDDRDDNEVFESLVAKLAKIQTWLNDLSGTTAYIHKLRRERDEARKERNEYYRLMQLAEEAVNNMKPNEKVEAPMKSPFFSWWCEMLDIHDGIDSRWAARDVADIAFAAGYNYAMKQNNAVRVK